MSILNEATKALKSKRHQDVAKYVLEDRIRILSDFERILSKKPLKINFDTAKKTYITL